MGAGPLGEFEVSGDYSMMVEIRPSPTVWPPSRMANLSLPSHRLVNKLLTGDRCMVTSMAISTLVPLESVSSEMSPVMSVVRK